MQKAMGSKAIFLSYTLFVAVCSLILLSGMLLSPSEPGNSILLGLSLPRLVLAIGLLAAFLFFAFLFLQSIRNAQWAEKALEQWFNGGRRSQILAWLGGVSLGLGWTGCFLPAYRAGPLSNYWTRIQPMMVFILCFGIATLTVFLIRRIDFSTRDAKASGIFRLAATLFVASLFLLGFMLISKYGLSAPEDFWYGAGVPILTLQLTGVFFAGALFLLLVRQPFSLRFDIAVFVILWLVTAALWAREPLQKSFLFTEPRAPNQELYPFADSAAFDAGSQFALIGQGIYIFNGPFNDRPLYLSLLVYLHSLFGQNYELLMAAQAALFAVLPGLIYLIGRSQNMRAVGLAAALVAMLRGINSIAGSSMIDMANPKMILSDFPAAIGVALIILFTCEWLKKPEQRWQYALWLGGAIGLTLMIRPHALVILVVLPFYAILRFVPRWKSWLLACMLIGLGVLAVTLPWEVRNVARGGIMYRSIVIKIQDVIRTRYSAPNGTGSISPSEANLSTLTLQNTKVISSLFQKTSTLQEQACNSIVCFAPRHFLHNTVMSILVLPTSPVFDDLRHTVKGDQTIWRADWQGNFAPVSVFFFVLNVFFILLGISVAWKHQGLPGLVPLAVFAIYNLSNSVARTSGGRYVVPADWIIPLYFMAGVLFLFKELASASLHKPLSITDLVNKETTISARSPWLTTVFLFSLLFAIGSIVPLSEMLHAPRYGNAHGSKIIQERQSQIAAAGLDPDEIDTFLKNPGAELLIGQTLYPRSYKLGQGEVTFYFYPFTVMDFPRTGFFLIGPHGQDNIVLPGGIPSYLPHATDALVIGCRGQNYVDALLVIALDKMDAVYVRSPLSELTCPLKQPVCENNSSCQ